MGNQIFAAGSVQVHKKVLAEIVSEALKKVDGVALQKGSLLTKLAALLGHKSTPGIDISVDKDQEIAIAVHIFVRYGCNIPGISNHVQSAIREAIEKAVDIKCEKINVNIQGIEGE